VSQHDDRDLAEIRRLLASREGECWLRLEDAVSELVAVHGVAELAIFRRIAALFEDERAAAAPDASA
jgi:hypothetical protein